MQMDEQEQAEQQRQLLRRFKWLVAAVTVFCLVMIFWLPR